MSPQELQQRAKFMTEPLPQRPSTAASHRHHRAVQDVPYIPPDQRLRHLIKPRADKMKLAAGSGRRKRTPNDAPLIRPGLPHTTMTNKQLIDYHRTNHQQWAGGFSAKLDWSHPEVSAHSDDPVDSSTDFEESLEWGADGHNACACQFAPCMHQTSAIASVQSTIGARPGAQSTMQDTRKEWQRALDEKAFLEKKSKASFRYRVCVNNKAVFHRGVNIG